jgi:hypothetical protein
MNQIGEFVPSHRLLAFFEKLDAAFTKLAALEESVARMERAINDLRECVSSQRPVKEFYTPVEIAVILGKRPYTVREWCRLGRVKARKGIGQYGSEQDWRIAHEELVRYQNEGLLPLPRS